MWRPKPAIKNNFFCPSDLRAQTSHYFKLKDETLVAHVVGSSVVEVFVAQFSPSKPDLLLQPWSAQYIQMSLTLNTDSTIYLIN